MGFRNRCQVLGPNGIVQLSIPLAGGRDQKKLTRDIVISDTVKWQSRHWKTLESCYNKSPWFDHYRRELGELYRTPFKWLVDWNLACLMWIKDKLSLPASFQLTEDYRRKYDPDTWTDLRDFYRPDKIPVSFPVTEKYPQVFDDRFGFTPHLSVLDRLFCAGRPSKDG